MIEFLCGNPGTGKTLTGTMKAIKYHKSRKTKNALKLVNKALPVENQLKTLVFSNYPILLDAKKGIYSNYISFWNMTTDELKSFFMPPGAYIIMDECQVFAESRGSGSKRFDPGISQFIQ